MTPQLLKPAVAEALNDLLAPIQEAFQASTEWQEIALKAYPPPVKEKKVKDKGTRHPEKRTKNILKVPMKGLDPERLRSSHMVKNTPAYTIGLREYRSKNVSGRDFQ